MDGGVLHSVSHPLSASNYQTSPIRPTLRLMCQNAHPSAGKKAAAGPGSGQTTGTEDGDRGWLLQWGHVITGLN